MELSLLAKQIFENEKDFLLRRLTPSNNPIAGILGGQPASGKSNLVEKMKSLYPNDNFLVVNGDLYREYHPQYESLKNNAEAFSAETQIFSNVFTEALIAEAIKNQYNIIIEGTMRNPLIPLQTAQLFNQNNFKVEALAISAPALFTELGIYIRYQEEINLQGWGRLAEISSHNEAVTGLPKSLDLLFDEKAVDKIHLYNFQAKKHIESFVLQNDKWNITTKPSVYIEATREIQLENNKERLQNIINRGNATFSEIKSNLKDNVSELVREVEVILKNLENENKKGFKR